VSSEFPQLPAEEQALEPRAEPLPELPQQGRGDRIARRIFIPLAVAALVLGVGYIFYSPLRVQGDSMEPNLHNADRILRDKHAGVAKRGDIVLLDVGTPSTSDDIVKRVIAVAGDTVEVKQDVPFVNGVPEKRTNIIIVPSAAVNMPVHTVPEGTIFVMGDNRPVSLDSRFVGPIRLSKVRGTVVWVILPLSDFGPPK